MTNHTPRDAEPLAPADAFVPVETGFYLDAQGGRWEVLFVAIYDQNDRDGDDLPEPAAYVGPSLSGVPESLTFRQGRYGHYYYLSEWTGRLVVYAREQPAGAINAGAERSLFFTSEEYFAGKEGGMKRFTRYERVVQAQETA